MLYYGLKKLTDINWQDVSGSNTISDSEWARFRRYACRVRKFHYQHTEGSETLFRRRIFHSILGRLVLSRSHLFPYLQELTWFQLSTARAAYTPFISPSLRRITLHVQPSAPDLSSAPINIPTYFHYPLDIYLQGVLQPGYDVDYSNILQQLDHWSPQIKELRLEGIGSPFVLGVPPPPQKTTRFRHMRMLYLGTVSSPPSVVLARCTGMPNLELLSLAFSNSRATVLPPAMSSPVIGSGLQGGSTDSTPTLDALVSLHASGAPSQIEQLLAAITSSSFHSATLSVSVPEGDSDGWTRICALLSSRFASSLHTLRAECTRTDTYVTSQPRSFANMVMPLLLLPALRRCMFTVRDTCGVALDAGDVAAIAAAWKDLEALELAFFDGGRGTRPTITCLEALARGCPALRKLRIPVNMDVSDLVSAAQPQYMSTIDSLSSERRLKELWLDEVYYASMESKAVIKFLQRSFPNVDLRPMVNAGVLHSHSD